MTTYDFFSEASNYTFDKVLIRKLLSFSKGKLPKSIYIQNNLIYFKKLNKSIPIDSKPTLICKYVKESIYKKKKNKNNLKIKLNDIEKNKKAFASLIYHFTKKYQKENDISDESRKQLESYINYEYTRKRLTLDNFILDNNELIFIRGLQFKYNKFFIQY